MFRATPVIVRHLLDAVFGLPGIIVFGVLGGAGIGFALGWTTIVERPLREKPVATTVASRNSDGAMWLRSPKAPGRSRSDVVFPGPALAAAYDPTMTMAVADNTRITQTAASDD